MTSLLYVTTSTHAFHVLSANTQCYLQGEAATTAGEIYLVIFTFFASPLWLKAFEPMRRKLKLSSQMLLQWGVPVASYFWISVGCGLGICQGFTFFTSLYAFAFSLTIL